MTEKYPHTAGFLEAIQYAAQVAKDLGAEVRFADKEYEKGIKRDDTFYATVSVGDDSSSFEVSPTPDRSYSRYNAVNQVQIAYNGFRRKFIRRVNPETPLSEETKMALKDKVKEVFDQTKWAVQGRIDGKEIAKKEEAFKTEIDARVKDMGFKNYVNDFWYSIYGTKKNPSLKIEFHTLDEDEFFKLLTFARDELKLK